ncbi:MAG: polysaccharide biosynthesis/export family protein [Pseudomonadota bacterium]
MHFSLAATVKRCSVLVLLPLAACVNLEPGMRIDADKVPSTRAPHAPTPVITLITPALVQAERARRGAPAADAVQALYAAPGPYLIGKGDVLSILVWDHPELNIASAGAQALTGSGAQSPAAYVVDQDGIVQFPYVGPIKLAGLTELQARNLLGDKLVKSIKRPDLTLRVLAFRSKRIYVDGEVKTPGNHAIDDVPMTLLEGVSRAGGFMPTSDKSRIVVSRGGVSYPVNLPLLVQQGADPGRLMLAPGDVLRVPSRDENKVYVLGEVTAPKALPMNNGRLTLADALGEAGGLNQTSAAARQVYVVRNAGEAEPLVYNLDAASPVALALAGNFELEPRDVVFVDASGLARYNRIINLILPTAVGAATTIGQAK